MNAELKAARAQVLDGLLDDVEGAFGLLRIIEQSVKKSRNTGCDFDAGRAEGHFLLRVRSITKRIGQVHILQSCLSRGRRG